MGSVYEAEHTVLRRRVALKALHPRFARVDEAVGRFVREAQAAASIGHPHIVDVVDFGVYEALPFLVMELLRGDTLAERMAHDTLDVTTACTLATQILSALSSAHAMGIVHRDLKPENVMLLGEGEKVRAKLLDFGVSKFLQGAPGKDLRATADGTLMGTPSYMSPEQWVGSPDIDHRADLYAVGVMLFEMLSGELPFEAPTQLEMYRIVALGEERPPRLDVLNAVVPDALASAVSRALSRNPDDRFSTAAEFFDALAPFAAELPAIDRALPRSRPMAVEPDPPEGMAYTGRVSNTPTIGPSAGSPATTRRPSTSPDDLPAPPLRSERGLRTFAILVAVLALGGGVFALTRTSDPTLIAGPPAPTATLRPPRLGPQAPPQAAALADSGPQIAASAPTVPGTETQGVPPDAAAAATPGTAPSVHRRAYGPTPPRHSPRPPREGDLLREF